MVFLLEKLSETGSAIFVSFGVFLASKGSKLPGMRPQLILLYSLIIHSSMNLFSQHSRQFILSFFHVLEAWETIFSQF